MVWRKFNFKFDPSAIKTEMDHTGPTFSTDLPVGMRTGATIHICYGLHMLISKRDQQEEQKEKEQVKVTVGGGK